MDCFVLGTGGMMPMPYRFLTSLAVRMAGSIYLFDCGEGTQIPYKKSHLGLRSLRVIAISHLHADHVLGLPGLLMLRGQMPDPEKLIIVGPPGLARFVRNVRKDLAMHIQYPIEIREYDLNNPSIEAYQDENLRLTWHPLEHSVFCVGYRIEEHERPGKFDLQAAHELGIPAGPLFGKLQQGQAVILPSGETIAPEQVVGEKRRGRRVAYITDTQITAKMQPILKEADLAFIETMFLEEHVEDAAAKKHMTAGQAAQAAAQAGVAKLRVFHFSPRYEGRDIRRFTEEASLFHDNAKAAREGEEIAVPLPP